MPADEFLKQGDNQQEVGYWHNRSQTFKQELAKGVQQGTGENTKTENTKTTKKPPKKKQGKQQQ